MYHNELKIVKPKFFYIQLHYFLNLLRLPPRLNSTTKYNVSQYLIRDV